MFVLFPFILLAAFFPNLVIVNADVERENVQNLTCVKQCVEHADSQSIVLSNPRSKRDVTQFFNKVKEEFNKTRWEYECSHAAHLLDCIQKCAILTPTLEQVILSGMQIHHNFCTDYEVMIPSVVCMTNVANHVKCNPSCEKEFGIIKIDNTRESADLLCE